MLGQKLFSKSNIGINILIDLLQPILAFVIGSDGCGDGENIGAMQPDASVHFLPPSFLRYRVIDDDIG